MIAQGKPEEVLTESHLKRAYGIEVKIKCEEGEWYVIPWKRAVKHES